jgi:D-alanyl-D-alanine carboxypeptidase (penicillin-binding protein 5/6)
VILVRQGPDFVQRTLSFVLGALAASAAGAQSRVRPESLDGPPVVTAKSWVILDAKSGGAFAGASADARRDMASTTKVMTALLVVEAAEKDPKTLDEVVVFSKRADKTEGSSAKIAEGEKVTVGNLLYGLLLPSGNDAATAFAEHFGRRMPTARLAPKETDPYALFVAEMNRRAGELGLTKTAFANPHGLTSPTHKSTADDLAKLAMAALQKPLFRAVVGARKFAGPVTKANGESRTEVWTNTNQLLDYAEYYGVKTGTTSAAGSCLIAAGSRAGDDLILVLLGCTSNESRYADARNLFRWAWSERAKKSKAASVADPEPAVQRRAGGSAK